MSRHSSLLKNEVESGYLLENTALIAMASGLLAPPSHKVYGSLVDSNVEEQGHLLRNVPSVASINNVNKEQDDQEKVAPTAGDLLLAVLYILLGAVALVAGIVSITSQDTT